MEDKFYTIEQVANILDLHHKTIRRFISDGKLNANKIGKQWRISEEDLNKFTKEKDNTKKPHEFDFSKESVENKQNRISVSTVVDIDDVDLKEYQRLSSLLLAISNAPNTASKKTSINMKYSEWENKLRILLWGSAKYVEDVLSSITLLIEEVE